MLQAVRNAFVLPDLRRKLLFTFLILVVYRLASHVPVPGVDLEALRRVFESNQLLGFLDLLSGGAMSSFSVMAMGVYPYITASIIMQLLQPIIPQLEELAKEGEAGRNKLNQYTHLMTIPLAFLQGFGQATILQQQGVISNFGLVPATLLPTMATLTALTAGTVFAIWLGELISEQGIGNGISLIIFGGIVARVPQSVGGLWLRSPWTLFLFLLVTVITDCDHSGGYRDCAGGTAAHSCPIWQASAGYAGPSLACGRWSEYPYSFTGQLGRNDPSHFRSIFFDLSRGCGQLFPFYPKRVGESYC